CLQPRLKRIAFYDNSATPESQSQSISMSHLKTITIAINTTALLHLIRQSFCKRLILHREIQSPCRVRVRQNPASAQSRGGVEDCLPCRTRIYPSTRARPVLKSRRVRRARIEKSKPERIDSYRIEILAMEP